MKPPKKKPRKIFLFKRADVERLRDIASHMIKKLSVALSVSPPASLMIFG